MSDQPIEYRQGTPDSESTWTREPSQNRDDDPGFEGWPDAEDARQASDEASQNRDDAEDLSEFVTERETTVSWSPGERVVRLYTNVAKHLRAFRADDAYTETQTWPAEPEKKILEAAAFEIRRDLYDPARGRRRPRTLTEEQKQVVGDRMRAWHASQNRDDNDDEIE